MSVSSSLFRPAAFATVLGVALLAGGCERAPVPAGDTSPVQAMAQLVDDLRRNDLAAYARHAVPPALYARLQSAWADGRTLWPLTELPLDARLQGLLDALAAPGSEQQLLAAYQRQFAGAHGELRAAATTLGLFATQYVNHTPTYSEPERDHYGQLIAALSRWGRRAPLGEPAYARENVPRLALAARATGLAGAGGLHQAGMERSLQRLGPFSRVIEQVLGDYGLDFDAALADMRIDLAEQTGDRARVRLRYALAGQTIDAVVLLERQGGHWYLSDLLRRAEAAAAPPPVLH